MKAALLVALAVVGFGMGLGMGCANDSGRTSYRDDRRNEVPPPTLPPGARERQPVVGDHWVSGSLSEEEARRLGLKPDDEAAPEE